MIKISKQTLTVELKKQVDDGFSRHAIEMVGHDEKFDPVAFVAEDNSRLDPDCYLNLV